MSVHDNIFHTYKDHNPFWRARAPKYMERREALFYTMRQKPPGMFAKASWVAIVFCALYGLNILKRARERRERFSVINYEFTRKALPFLQAIEDRRYLAMGQRKTWMLEELFKNNREEYLALSRLFHDPTLWAEPFSRTSLYQCGVPKNFKGPLRGAANYFTGDDPYAQGYPESHF